MSGEVDEAAELGDDDGLDASPQVWRYLRVRDLVSPDALAVVIDEDVGAPRARPRRPNFRRAGAQAPGPSGTMHPQDEGIKGHVIRMTARAEVVDLRASVLRPMELGHSAARGPVTGDGAGSEPPADLLREPRRGAGWPWSWPRTDRSDRRWTPPRSGRGPRPGPSRTQALAPA